MIATVLGATPCAPPVAAGVDRAAPRGRVMGQGAQVDARFAEFAGTRGPALVRLARGLLRDPYQAEDVVQDVLAKALVQWGRVSAADDPDAYVRRMVINACTSWFRRAARREFAHDAATLPERAVTDPTDGIDERDRVIALLRRLPTKQRTVLVLRHYEGMRDAEIARLLGSSEVSVRTNAHRGLTTLRRLLAEAADQAAGPGGEEVNRS
ncbi:MAG TPA: SigE family RNA polymerase sigma factor [Kineosporiaceae bacterium]